MWLRKSWGRNPTYQGDFQTQWLQCYWHSRFSTPDGRNIHSGEACWVALIPYMQGGYFWQEKHTYWDNLDLKIPGMYSSNLNVIRYKLGWLETMYKECTWHIHLYQMFRLVVAGQNIETWYCIDFIDITVLARTAACMDNLVKETIEIPVHPNGFNRDMWFTISCSWNPAVNVLQWSRAIK
jgi:hypothetical protein